MTAVPDELLYSKDHEWIKTIGGIATLGITDHAQQALGEIGLGDLVFPFTSTN